MFVASSVRVIVILAVLELVGKFFVFVFMSRFLFSKLSDEVVATFVCRWVVMFLEHDIAPACARICVREAKSSGASQSRSKTHNRCIRPYSSRRQTAWVLQTEHALPDHGFFTNSDLSATGLFGFLGKLARACRKNICSTSIRKWSI